MADPSIHSGPEQVRSTRGRPGRRVVGKRAPEDVASSEVSKRPRIQGTSTACDKDSDKREIMEPAKPESEAISSAGATMLQSDGYSCEHFDGKIERTFCAHCDRRIWSLRCGVDREQGWLHPECFLEWCPSARCTPPGLVTQFAMLSPSQQCCTLQLLNKVHTTPAKARQLQMVETEYYEAQDLRDATAEDERLVEHEQVVSQLAGKFALAQLIAAMGARSSSQLENSVQLAEKVLDAQNPVLEEAKRQVSSIASLKRALLSQKVSDLADAIAQAEACGLPSKMTEAARDQLAKETAKAEAFQELKSARRSRDPERMASASTRAASLGVEAPNLILELATDAASIVKDRRRRLQSEARNDLILCSDLDPAVKSETLIVAINRATAAGLSPVDLHDAHVILDKKLLLEELSLAVHEERTCDVRALHARAQHLCLSRELLLPAARFLEIEATIDEAVEAIFTRPRRRDWVPALQRLRRLGVNNALTHMAEHFGLIGDP
ncbi:unnamed protein product [Symbiodinium sp. CCMP2592]|nr:unnamed protein product [Symbiodinium sp. CCMP2592]